MQYALDWSCENSTVVKCKDLLELGRTRDTCALSKTCRLGREMYLGPRYDVAELLRAPSSIVACSQPQGL
jgi:hypothetical protein